MIAAAPMGVIFWRPLVITLCLHALMVYVLTLNWDSQSEVTVKPRQLPSYIEARLVSADMLKPKPKPAVKAVPKPQPKKVAPAPKPAATPAASKPAPAKTVAPAKPVAKPVVAAGPSAQERAAAAKTELSLALAQEDELLEAASDDEVTQSYVALIARVIEENWSRPPSARNNMEAELVIQLIPTGEVVSVTLVSSSGMLAFDRAAVMAVQKAERFPELQQLPSRIFEKDFRKLRLKFKPEDLRF